MSRIIVLVAAALAVVAVMTAPASARPLGLPTYSVSGVETGIPQDVGGGDSSSPFAGTATSSSGGAVWKANVVHNALSNCLATTSSCTITGGTFKLVRLFSTVSGRFDSGGTITPLADIGPCVDEQYDVRGTLTTTAGPAEFNATLTHFQAQVPLVGCVTYFATVRGTFGP
jgi:hypothetical protein